VHEASRRADAPLIDINCAALPETVVESELFGHVRGAYTGASTDRGGKFELAHRGTIFLDEVGELPLSVQPKLLRVLQQGEIQRVGSDRLLHVDVRVIAATNRDLVKEVAEGRFRADLYHRLNMYPIEVPPLKARRDDIPLLAGVFLDRYRRRLGPGPIRLTESARTALVGAEWPGNVRELDHVLGRAVLRASASHARGAPIRLEREHLDLGPGVSLRPEAPEASPELPPSVWVATGGKTLRAIVEETKQKAVRAAVEASGGNWAAAARSLGMARSNFHTLAARLGVRAERES